MAAQGERMNGIGFGIGERARPATQGRARVQSPCPEPGRAARRSTSAAACGTRARGLRRWACAAVVVASCADPGAFEKPVLLENCGGSVRVERPPERVVALNQPATEVLLALGLADRIVASGWQDNDPTPEFAQAYHAIPTRWPYYPEPQQFVAAQPDFAYATFTSAFNDDVQTARQSLKQHGIEIYVSPWACGAGGGLGELTFDAIPRELEEIASVFGVTERGAQLAAELRQGFDAVRAAAQERPGPPPVIALYISGDATPSFAAGEGVAQLLTDALRALNPYGQAQGAFTASTWELFARQPPNWMVLVDRLDSPAAHKRDVVLNQPATKDLRFAREERFIVVPFSDILSGVGVVRTAQRIADAIERDVRFTWDQPERAK